MKILICAYRDWAKDVFFGLCLAGHVGEHDLVLTTTPTEMEALSREQEWDAIVMIGWSWKIPADIVNSRLVVAMHPSDLPNYAGGSPIQNQILDGVKKTNATLFKANEKFDEGEIVDKEPISLEGHLDEVLQSISEASKALVFRFILNFPNNTYTKQEGEGIKVKRLKPEESKLPFPEPGSGCLTVKELWDFIRCREDPYPNVYFEDATGRLTIKRVEFEPKS